MVVVIIFFLLFIAGIISLVYGIKKDSNFYTVLGLCSSLWLGTFLWFTVFVYPPSKEYVESTIEYYNSLKKRVETLEELDPECKDVVINVFVPGLKTEVDKINEIIEYNRSRIGTWNEYFISKDLANLEKICY